MRCGTPTEFKALWEKRKWAVWTCLSEAYLKARCTVIRRWV